MHKQILPATIQKIFGILPCLGKISCLILLDCLVLSTKIKGVGAAHFISLPNLTIFCFMKKYWLQSTSFVLNFKTASYNMLLVEKKKKKNEYANCKRKWGTMSKITGAIIRLLGKTSLLLRWAPVGNYFSASTFINYNIRIILVFTG